VLVKLRMIDAWADLSDVIEKISYPQKVSFLKRIDWILKDANDVSFMGLARLYITMKAGWELRGGYFPHLYNILTDFSPM